jgi:hypothetical protein
MSAAAFAVIASSKSCSSLGSSLTYAHTPRASTVSIAGAPVRTVYSSAATTLWCSGRPSMRTSARNDIGWSVRSISDAGVWRKPPSQAKTPWAASSRSTRSSASASAPHRAASVSALTGSSPTWSATPSSATTCRHLDAMKAVLRFHSSSCGRRSVIVVIGDPSLWARTRRTLRRVGEAAARPVGQRRRAQARVAGALESPDAARAAPGSAHRSRTPMT